jgi:hypothetical protein
VPPAKRSLSETVCWTSPFLQSGCFETATSNMHQPLLPRAIAISLQFRHGVYDCLYIALAEREGCGLLTADTKLLLKLRGTFPLLSDLASVP